MSEKMRAEFELFCDSIGYHYIRDGDDYLGSYGKTMWIAWKASRAALVVELPDEGAVWWHQDIREELDDAGVSYK